MGERKEKQGRKRKKERWKKNPNLCLESPALVCLELSQFIRVLHTQDPLNPRQILAQFYTVLQKAGFCSSSSSPPAQPTIICSSLPGSLYG